MTSRFSLSTTGLIFLFLFSSCYNFKGISIPPDINTFFVDNFSLSEPDAPIDLNQLFTEALREKIREESRLVNNNDDPDIVFSGSIVNYSIKFVAPDENNTTSLNRMEIGVRVNYSNERDPDDNWTKNYSDFEDFDSNADFQSLQDQLIDDIIEDIVERIFNDSFTNW